MLSPDNCFQQLQSERLARLARLGGLHLSGLCCLLQVALVQQAQQAQAVAQVPLRQHYGHRLQHPAVLAEPHPVVLAGVEALEVRGVSEALEARHLREEVEVVDLVGRAASTQEEVGAAVAAVESTQEVDKLAAVQVVVVVAEAADQVSRL